MYCCCPGAVPPYYRDVYDALCPENTELISQNILTKVMMKSGLDKNILSQVSNDMENNWSLPFIS